jgi:hypothetical protein
VGAEIAPLGGVVGRFRLCGCVASGDGGGSIINVQNDDGVGVVMKNFLDKNLKLLAVTLCPIAICKIIDFFSRKHYHKKFASPKVTFRHSSMSIGPGIPNF